MMRLNAYVIKLTLAAPAYGGQVARITVKKAGSPAILAAADWPSRIHAADTLQVFYLEDPVYRRWANIGSVGATANPRERVMALPIDLQQPAKLTRLERGTPWRQVVYAVQSKDWVVGITLWNTGRMEDMCADIEGANS